MTLNKFFTIAPLSIATLAVMHKFLKCPKQDVAKVKQLFYRNGRPVVFGHRAGQCEAPENTLTAIETAVRNGATAIEIDLDFTKDNVPIIFHDDTVDRITTSSGKTSSFNFEELSKLNCAIYFPYKIIGKKKIRIDSERIPTLYEAVELSVKHGLTIDLDIKSNAKKAAEVLKSLLKKYPDATEYIFLSSFNPFHVYTLRKECPDYAAGIIWRHGYLAYTIDGEPRYPWYVMPVFKIGDRIMKYAIHNWLPGFLGLSVVVMQKNLLSSQYIHQWKQQGIEVVAWTVNSPLEKQYMLEYHKIPVITDSILNVECDEQTT